MLTSFKPIDFNWSSTSRRKIDSEQINFVLIQCILISVLKIHYNIIRDSLIFAIRGLCLRFYPKVFISESARMTSFNFASSMDSIK